MSDYDPSKSCGPQHSVDDQPTHSWTLDQLKEYTQQQYQRIIADERTLAPAYWRLGHALTLARKQFGHGQWERYLESLGIDKTRSSKARVIFRHFSAPDALQGLTVDQAYQARRTARVKQECAAAKEAAVAASEFARSAARIEKAGEIAVNQSGQLTPAERRDLLQHVKHMIGRLQAMQLELERTLTEEERLAGRVPS